MQCPSCGAQNPDEAFFCGSCGGQLRSAMQRPGGPLSLDPPPPAGAPSPNRIDLAAIGQAALDAEEAQQGASRSDPLAPRDPLAPASPAAPAAPPAAYVAPPPGAMPPAAPYQPQSPYQPSAGIYQPPASPGAAPGGQYQLPGQYQPPGQYPQGQLPPLPATGGYPYAPLDGNTSGMGPGYPLPRETEGWTFGGFIPWGLFCFLNGNTTWGVIGLISGFLGLGLVYNIYAGIKGKEMAWQGRRFDSIQQFNETMRAWNQWGIVVLFIAAGLVVLYILLMVFAFSAAMMSSGGK